MASAGCLGRAGIRRNPKAVAIESSFFLRNAKRFLGDEDSVPATRDPNDAPCYATRDAFLIAGLPGCCINVFSNRRNIFLRTRKVPSRGATSYLLAFNVRRVSSEVSVFILRYSGLIEQQSRPQVTRQRQVEAGRQSTSTRLLTTWPASGPRVGGRRVRSTLINLSHFQCALRRLSERGIHSASTPAIAERSRSSPGRSPPPSGLKSD